MAAEGESPTDCTYVVNESSSCRVVEDEDGQLVRECLRTRSTLRHCLGREPEVLTRDEMTTRERVSPRLGGSTDSSSSSSCEPSWSPFPGPLLHSAAPGWLPGFGRGPEGLARSGESGQLGEQPPQDRSGPLQALGSWPWAQGAWASSLPGPGAGRDWDKQRVADALDAFVHNAEASARSVLEQLVQDLEGFQPFRGIHNLLAPRHPDSGEHNPDLRHPEPGTPAVGAPNRRLYDQLSRDFDEV